jgi:hypothetical protein
MLFDTTTKDDRANPMVEIGMEGGTLILIQLKSSIVFITIALNFVAVIE